MSACRLVRALLLGATAVTALGARCGGGDGGGGSPPIIAVESFDPRCVALTAAFPAGFDFVPGLGGQVLVTNEQPQAILRFDVGAVPFSVPPGVSPLGIPVDSDGDGFPEFLGPILDDVIAVAPDLALVTATNYEEVMFVEPSVALRSFEVRVPAGTSPDLYRLLPPPGTSALRTAVSTLACVTPAPGAVDSRGDLLANVLPVTSCAPGDYPTRFTSGAAVADSKLFVATSNTGEGEGTENTQFLPGTVLVFDLDLNATPPVISPHATTPVLTTTAFNPTHVTRYVAPGPGPGPGPGPAAGREFILVGLSGAIGIRRDDPATSVREGGGVGITDGAIDVIDPTVPAVVATFPLPGANPFFDALAVDPTGRVALSGDALRRSLYAVDLDLLAGLPPGLPAGQPPLVLDTSVIFDGAAPFRIPEIPNGAPLGSCAGFTAGVAVNDAGDRAYVVEQCDGVLAQVGIDLSGPPPFPVPASRFRLLALESIAAPVRDDTFGLPRQPGRVRVRPGRPGVDFAGPDLFFTMGTPEGLLCGLAIESP